MIIHHFPTLKNEVRNIKALFIFDKALCQETIWRNLETAKHIYLLIIKHYHTCRDITAKALFQLGIIHEKQKDFDTAHIFFSYILKNYPDQEKIHNMARTKNEKYYPNKSKKTVL